MEGTVMDKNSSLAIFKVEIRSGVSVVCIYDYDKT